MATGRPKTLSRREFLQVKPGGDYSKYLAFLARVRPQRQAARRRQEMNAWMQPLSEKDIRTRARSDIMPAVNAMMREIEQSVGRRSKAGMSAITGYTTELANALMPFYSSAGSIYDQAAGQVGALTSALPAALVGQGQALGADLGAKLGAIDAPDAQIANVAGGAQNTGAAAGQAQGALGTADLNRLRSDQQADRAYSAAFPGIAGLEGATNARGLQLALNRELADTLGELTRQVPSQISELVRSYRDAEFDKGIARSTAQQERQKFTQEAQADRAKREADNKKLRPAPEQVNRSTGYIMGYNAVGQLVPYLGPDGKPIRYKPKPSTASKSGGKDDSAKEKAEADQENKDYFYEVRNEAFERAREYATAGNRLTDRMPRADAKRRLMAEFGALLIGRGYPRKTVVQMIDRALDAAY